MSLDEVKRKIMDLANEKAREIRKEAARRAAEIARENDENIKKMLRSGRERYAESAALQKDRQVGAARVEARNRLLDAKQKIIDGVVEDTLASILALPDGEYLGFMRRLFAAADIPDGECEVQISRADEKRITAGFLGTVEAELSKSGKKPILKLSGTRKNEIKGGFIVRSGQMEIDCSLDAIIKMSRGEMEREAAQILFGGLDA